MDSFQSHLHDVVSNVLCPITLSLPIEPVMAEDGNVYELTAIQTHLNNRKTSPVTNMAMGNKLIPAPHVTNIIYAMKRWYFSSTCKTDESGLLDWLKDMHKQKTSLAAKRVNDYCNDTTYIDAAVLRPLMKEYMRLKEMDLQNLESYTIGHILHVNAWKADKMLLAQKRSVIKCRDDYLKECKECRHAFDAKFYARLIEPLFYLFRPGYSVRKNKYEAISEALRMQASLEDEMLEKNAAKRKRPSLPTLKLTRRERAMFPDCPLYD